MKVYPVPAGIKSELVEMQARLDLLKAEISDRQGRISELALAYESVIAKLAAQFTTEPQYYARLDDSSSFLILG